MAGDKYLKYSTTTGIATEQAAVQTSAGAGDAGKIIALDSAGLIAANMMPTGIVAETASIVASENLAAGDWVNIHISSGIKVRKADGSTTGKPAMGFVLAAVTAPAAATVCFEGFNTQVTGRTPGAVQFLSVTTPGGSQETVPSGAGQTSQRIGVAISATSVGFEPRDEIVLA